MGGHGQAPYYGHARGQLGGAGAVESVAAVLALPAVAGFIPGAGTVLDVARGQVERGHDVGFFCDSTTGGTRAAAAW